MEAVPLPGQIHDAMIAHARFCLPEEACGLMAVDHEGAIRMVYATTNVVRSPVRFTVSPNEHFGALRHAERQGWVIAGSFHSHPDSAAYPSASDVAGALDPTWLYVIVGMGNGGPVLRGFRIRGSKVSEIVFWESP
ncbi:MAG: M67 family metallopeptidase [Actinomycetota bacterium]|nr:M67 family metallopeptidase [Actinomycetota bacterium]